MIQSFTGLWDLWLKSLQIFTPSLGINSQLTLVFLTPSENAALVAFIQQQTCVNTGSYNPHSRGFQRVRGSKLAKDITGEVGVHLCYTESAGGDRESRTRPPASSPLPLKAMLPLSLTLLGVWPWCVNKRWPLFQPWVMELGLEWGESWGQTDVRPMRSSS